MSAPTRNHARLGEVWFLATRSSLPGLLGAAVCLLAMLVLGSLQFDKFFSPLVPSSLRGSFPTSLPNRLADYAAQVRGRFVFGLSAVTLLMGALGVFVASWFVISGTLAETWPKHRRLVLTCTLAATAMGFTMATMSQTTFFAGRSDLISVIFRTANIAHKGQVHFVLAVVNSSIIAVCLLMGVSFSVLTVPPPPGGRDETSDLGTRMRRLRTLLYVGSGCLALRALQVHSTHVWLATLVPKESADVLTSVAASASAAVGLIFSVFLCSIYVPAAALLHGRLVQLSAGQPGNEAGAERGTTFNPSQELVRILALLSPILVGLFDGPIASAVGKMFQSIGGK